MTTGYLYNASEWEERLLKASHERMPYPLWQLFDISLVYSLPNSPLGLWERFKKDLCEDFQREFGLDMDDRKFEYKTLQSPLGLWERFKKDLCEDFQREFGLDMDDRKFEYKTLQSPLGLWERFKKDLCEDFQREFGLDMDDRKFEYKTLQRLDNILRVNGKHWRTTAYQPFTTMNSRLL
ncbi:Helitron helicase-like protein [Phytophthora palmivora]|uniref:Helitron helicase-like protein n=1 Tax=Phytophthora palmivora TaxID=4796 RepID=A0A2P4XGL3_9STRA|nr:Helitron helicase-like protein [Phytophthora palmivora]